MALYNSFSVDTNTGECYGVASQRSGSYDHESLDWGGYTSAGERCVGGAIAAATNGSGFFEDEDVKEQRVKRQRTLGIFSQKGMSSQPKYDLLRICQTPHHFRPCILQSRTTLFQA